MSSRTILVIDNDTATTEEIRALVAPDGHQTIACATAAEGKALALSVMPDLCIIAVELPDTNGFIVCSALKKDPQTAEMPIFITSTAETTDAFNAHLQLDVHAEGYFLKPLNKEVFLANINEQFKYLDEVEAYYAAEQAAQEQAAEEQTAADEDEMIDVSQATDDIPSGTSEELKAIDIDGVDIFGEIDTSDVEEEDGLSFEVDDALDAKNFKLESQVNDVVDLDANIPDLTEEPAQVTAAAPAAANLNASISSTANRAVASPLPSAISSSSVRPAINAVSPIKPASISQAAQPISAGLRSPAAAIPSFPRPGIAPLTNSVPSIASRLPAAPKLPLGQRPASVSATAPVPSMPIATPATPATTATDPNPAAPTEVAAPAATSEEIAQLNETLSQLKAELEAVTAERDQLRTECAQLREEKTLVRAEADQLRMECSQKDAEQADLKFQFDTLAARCQAAEADAEAVRNQAAQNVSYIESYQAQAAQDQAVIAELTESNNALTNKLQEFVDSNQTMYDQFQIVHADAIKRNDQLKDIIARLTTLIVDIQE